MASGKPGRRLRIPSAYRWATRDASRSPIPMRRANPVLKTRVDGWSQVMQPSVDGPEGELPLAWAFQLPGRFDWVAQNGRCSEGTLPLITGAHSLRPAPLFFGEVHEFLALIACSGAPFASPLPVPSVTRPSSLDGRVFIRPTAIQSVRNLCAPPSAIGRPASDR